MSAFEAESASITSVESSQLEIRLGSGGAGETADKRLKIVLEMRRSFQEVRKDLSRELRELQDENVTVDQFRRDLENIIPKEIDDFELEVSKLEKELAVQVIFSEILAFLSLVMNRGVNPSELSAIGAQLGLGAHQYLSNRGGLKKSLPSGYLNYRFKSKIPV